MFKIYWSDAANQAHSFDTASLTEALATVEAKRKEGFAFVTMASVDANSVGKPGVSSVQGGKLPDGSTYDWSKADRAGKTRKHDRVLAVKETRK